MLISNIAALLPLAAMWLVFRKCFAPARVLLYAEIDRAMPSRAEIIYGLKIKCTRLPQNIETL